MTSAPRRLKKDFKKLPSTVKCHAMIRMDVLFSSKYDANSLYFRFIELSLRKKAIIYETDIYMATSDLGRVYMG